MTLKWNWKRRIWRQACFECCETPFTLQGCGTAGCVLCCVTGTLAAGPLAAVDQTLWHIPQMPVMFWDFRVRCQGNTLSYCPVYSNAKVVNVQRCSLIKSHITEPKVVWLFEALILPVFASLPQNDPLALNSTQLKEEKCNISLQTTIQTVF